LALDASEQSAAHSGHPPSAGSNQHLPTRMLVVLETGLDTLERRIISYSSQKLRHKSSVAPPIASLY